MGKIMYFMYTYWHRLLFQLVIQLSNEKLIHYKYILSNSIPFLLGQYLFRKYMQYNIFM